MPFCCVDAFSCVPHGPMVLQNLSPHAHAHTTPSAKEALCCQMKFLTSLKAQLECFGDIFFDCLSTRSIAQADDYTSIEWLQSVVTKEKS